MISICTQLDQHCVISEKKYMYRVCLIICLVIYKSTTKVNIIISKKGKIKFITNWSAGGRNPWAIEWTTRREAFDHQASDTSTMGFARPFHLTSWGEGAGKAWCRLGGSRTRGLDIGY